MVAKTIALPNVRKLFIPDPGHIIAEADLAGADAQVVAWESDDVILKEIFRSGKKLHAENAKAMFGGAAGSDGTNEPYYTETKRAVHATNYGAGPRAIAAANGWTTAKAQSFIDGWFELHPNIRAWQHRVEDQLNASRSVSNRFGYRIVYFDRVESLLPEALAWIPQSTVANLCTRGAIRVHRDIPWCTVLLQVHDSIVFQYPSEYHPRRGEILEALTEPVPYLEPLVIPWSLKVSRKSWGDAKTAEWGEAA